MSVNEATDVLDAWVLAENKIVTYKLLSRLLRVKVNHAKELMAQWHSTNPRTHATYVICGLDRVLQDNPVNVPSQGSSTQDDTWTSTQLAIMKPIRSRTVRLVPEEELEEVRSQFQEITSCHIYSLEPAKLKDIGLLFSVRNDIEEAMKGQSQKVVDLANTYGIIINTSVQKFEEANPGKGQSAKEKVPIFKKQATKEPELVKNEPPAVATEVVKKVEAQTSGKDVSGLKRNASRSLASAFVKTQKPKPKLEVEQPISSDSVSGQDIKTAKGSADDKVRLPRKQDAAKTELHNKMMEEDAEPQSQPKPAVPGDVAEVMADAEDWSASDTEMVDDVIVAAAPLLPPAEESSSRRRTKKKVKRQVHTTDAKGYMVTTEEWEWISCDEEEVTKPVTPTLARQNSSKTSVSKVKAVPKKKQAGQASIGNYFAKK